MFHGIDLAVGDVVRSARARSNVTPPLVDAAAAGATLGEMCDAFREVWGRYRDPVRW